MHPEEPSPHGAVQQGVGRQLAHQQGDFRDVVGVPALGHQPHGSTPAEADAAGGGGVVEAVLAEDGLGGGDLLLGCGHGSGPLGEGAVAMSRLRGAGSGAGRGGELPPSGAAV